jgi:hypothetical protein
MSSQLKPKFILFSTQMYHLNIIYDKLDKFQIATCPIVTIIYSKSLILAFKKFHRFIIHLVHMITQATDLK